VGVHKRLQSGEDRRSARGRPSPHADQTPEVLCTAFRSETGSGYTIAVHIANLAPERTAVLSGLPPELSVLQPYRTSETEQFEQLDLLSVTDGQVSFTLAAQSLVTLVGDYSVSGSGEGEGEGEDDPGDVNVDGSIDALDVQLVINAVLGLGTECDCDVNGDLTLDAADVQLVINAVLGLT